MKRSGVRIVTCALLVALAGCEDDPAVEAPPVMFGDGGPTTRITPDGGAKDGVANDDGGAGDGGDAAPLPQGVKINVTVTNPQKDVVIRSNANFKPTVDIEVTADTMALLDAVSIEEVFAEIELPKPTANQMAIKLGQIGQPLRGPDGKPEVIYSFGDVLVPLSALPSGEVMLKITATTKGSAVITRIPFKVDSGPTITFITPMADQPFKNSARISVSIVDAVFSPVKDVTISLGETPQVVTTGDPGVYIATIDFKSFNPRLSGRQLVTVRAKNSANTPSVASREFVADDVGPAFDMLSPIKGELIGGVIDISAVVTDPAGVDPSSVVAVVANGADVQFEVRLDPPALGGTPNLFKKRFDTKLLPLNAIYPTLSFRARDILGNESTDGYNLSLDNMPPILDLDPPDNMRLLSLSNGVYTCSWPFDPVGPDAVDDGQYVNQAFDVRVRAEDQGNDVVSGSIDFVPIGGLKNVSLLALDDTARALLVDTDGDEKCDAVNPLLVPTSQPMGSNQILLLSMDPLTKTGTPDTHRESPAPVECFTDETSSAKPEPLCEGAGPTVNFSKARYGDTQLPHSHFMSVFPSYSQGNLPSIWTLGPVRPGVECAGRQLESVGSNLTDGWACLAAVGEDTLGRKQVSRPIRVCIDRNGDGKECPHRTIVGVTFASLIEIETATDHGFTTGDDVFIQGVLCQTGANGKRKITVTGLRKFTLNGVNGRAGVCDAFGGSGFVAGFKGMPNCTGTQTTVEPMAQVDETKPCGPWRNFKDREQRIFK